jgi:hypothetical protein
MTNPDTQHTHERDDTLDTILRAELRWEVSPELTSQLLSLVPSATAPAQPARPQPHRWYTALVMLLTTMTMLLSSAVAWQFYGTITAELGLLDIWATLQATPAQGLAWLYQELPATRSLVAFLQSTHEHIVQWFLIAAVLWLALDSWSPRSSLQRQQA